MYKDSSGGGSEKWSDSGYILNMKPTGFSNGLDVGDREREIQNDSQVFSLSKWMDGDTISPILLAGITAYTLHVCPAAALPSPHSSQADLPQMHIRLCYPCDLQLQSNGFP